MFSRQTILSALGINPLRAAPFLMNVHSFMDIPCAQGTVGFS